MSGGGGCHRRSVFEIRVAINESEARVRRTTQLRTTPKAAHRPVLMIVVEALVIVADEAREDVDHHAGRSPSVRAVIPPSLA